MTREEKLRKAAGNVKRIPDTLRRNLRRFKMDTILTDAEVREGVIFHKERGALTTLTLMLAANTSRYGVTALNPNQNIASSLMVRLRLKPYPGILTGCEVARCRCRQDRCLR